MPKTTHDERALSLNLGATISNTPERLTRYPKRKREQVNYHISGDEAEEEEDIEDRVRFLPANILLRWLKSRAKMIAC
jgi:hypothetical protein